MPVLDVERIGGVAGVGLTRSHIRSHGRVDTATLPASEQRAVEELFRSHVSTMGSQLRDGFRYRISRTGPGGTETIEVQESLLPKAIIECVKDEIT